MLERGAKMARDVGSGAPGLIQGMGALQGQQPGAQGGGPQGAPNPDEMDLEPSLDMMDLGDVDAPL